VPVWYAHARESPVDVATILSASTPSRMPTSIPALRSESWPRLIAPDYPPTTTLALGANDAVHSCPPTDTVIVLFSASIPLTIAFPGVMASIRVTAGRSWAS
jgi:hypothetical protein